MRWCYPATVAAVPVLGLVICIAATRTDILEPQSTRPISALGAMAGAFTFFGFRLTTAELLPTVVAMLVAYFFAVRFSDRVSPRTVITAVIALNVMVLLAPPMFSTDMFSYQAYARMFTIYHVNPYTHTPLAISLDPIQPYLGAAWIQVATVYGPLFTLISAPLAWISVTLSEMTFKLVAALACAATLRLVWKSALLRGVNPVRALAIFGLNPVVMLACIGGGHNDALTAWLMTLGIYATLTGRDRRAGALMTAGAAIKLTGGVVLPFALLSSAGQDPVGRRRRLLAGVAAVTALLMAATLVFFGTGVFQLWRTLEYSQSQGAWQSLPGFLLRVAHLQRTSLIRDALNVLMLVIVARLLWLVWKQRMDWIVGATWATVAVLATAWSMLPWYVTWLMPLAAICNDKRAWRASLVMSGAAGAIMVANCVSSIPFLGI